DYPTEYRLQYHQLPGFQDLKQTHNPFPAGFIEMEGQKIGLIRIEYFSPSFYSQTAQVLWDDFRESLREPCDEHCQESFAQIIEKQLTDYLIQHLENLHHRGIDKLVVDVTGNGGGTEWAFAMARLFSPKTLAAPPFAFVKHPHWQNSLEEQMQAIAQDLQNQALSEELKSHLRQLQSTLKNLQEKAQQNCDPQEIWAQANIACLDLLRHPIPEQLPQAIQGDPQLPQLASKNLLGTARFLPYRRGPFQGPVYVAIDGGSASATEGFASLLQINQAAVLVGQTTYGVGCGYTNGGIRVDLENIGLRVRMPDCVRYRKDGENEMKGIEPDLPVAWEKSDSDQIKGERLIRAVAGHTWDFD
ncbi:MAG: S41 family peptidase, partial [Bacteroidota bacterium]